MSPESIFVTAIRQCEELPDEVRNARFSYIKKHRIDRTLLNKLETQVPNAIRRQDWPEQIDRRRKALTPFFDRNLICGYVRLPGVFYTIEVDPESRQIVHWEWENAS